MYTVQKKSVKIYFFASDPLYHVAKNTHSFILKVKFLSQYLKLYENVKFCKYYV